MKLYIDEDKDKKKFTLMPCWNILKAEDKWAARMVEIAEVEKPEKAKKNQKTTKVSRPRDEEGTNTEKKQSQMMLGKKHKLEKGQMELRR
jgi:hypothetical protein